MRPKKPASMKGLGALLESALGRHGIAKQVTAAMVVVRANEILAEMLQPPLSEDVKALTFIDGRLTLACRNSAASFDIAHACDAIGKRLEEAFPDITVRGVDARLKPEAWKEWS